MKLALRIAGLKLLGEIARMEGKAKPTLFVLSDVNYLIKKHLHDFASTFDSPQKSVISKRRHARHWPSKEQVVPTRSKHGGLTRTTNQIIQMVESCLHPTWR